MAWIGSKDMMTMLVHKQDDGSMLVEWRLPRGDRMAKSE